MRTRSHKTFDNEDIVENTLNPKDIEKIDNNNDNDNNSDSDEAPEEESVSISKKKIIDRQKDEAKILKNKRKEIKAKNKEINEKRKIAKLEKELKELEKQRKQIDTNQDEISNGELPEELLENVILVTSEEIEKKNQNNKILFNDKDEDKRLKRMNQRKKREERLKILRELKSKTEKVVDGGIHIKILSNNNDDNNNNKCQISARREEWLNRKRIRRE